MRVLECIYDLLFREDRNGEPYGYMLVDGQRAKNPEEQRVVRLIESLHANGLDYEQISRRLNAAHLRTRAGHRWTTSKVRKIDLAFHDENPMVRELRSMR
ncbi:MAG: recombinase family protein [Desulfovibrionaceae bacterium]|jgi:hypothetical protein|nr:recombinase family protein [Desulfovibrionaceae bacterium]